MSELSKVITDEEIYEQRKKRLTYKEIARYFTSQGREISSDKIRLICKKIYKEKKQEEKRGKNAKRRLIEVTDEEIYQMREKRLTYGAIAEYFTKQGKKISPEKIRIRCKKIYRLKSKAEPRGNNRIKKIIDIADEEIFELREKRLTYEAIAEYFTSQGKEISSKEIRVICKRIYEEKGKEEPIIEKKKPSNYSQITDEEIYELRKKGLNFREIAEHFTIQGRKISRQRIQQRCGTIFNSSNMKNEDKYSEKNLRKEILKLKDTKGATNEQIAKIASIYGIDLKIASKTNEER